MLLLAGRARARREGEKKSLGSLRASHVEEGNGLSGGAGAQSLSKAAPPVPKERGELGEVGCCQGISGRALGIVIPRV